MRDQLHEQLAHLRLRGIDAALDAQLDRAEREGSPPAEVLWRLLAEEHAHRREQSLAYRLTQAKLPWRWTLDSFPFDRQPGIDRGQIRALAGLDFLRRNENILLIGAPGTGKTGNRACPVARGLPQRSRRALLQRPDSARRTLRLARGSLDAQAPHSTRALAAVTHR
jgi:DNA replication protein DnaC